MGLTTILSGSFHKETSFTKSDDGHIYYMDRQKPDCQAGSAMSYFYLERNGVNRDQIRYDFTCLNSGNINGHVQDKHTNWGPVDGGHSVNYLDKHNVDCPKDTLIQSFRVERSGSKIRYSYKCAPAKILCCKSFTNNKTDMGNKSTFYLDRQPVGKRNSKNYAFKQFWLRSSYSPDRIWYQYEMCKVTDEEAENAVKLAQTNYDNAAANLQALNLSLRSLSIDLKNLRLNWKIIIMICKLLDVTKVYKMIVREIFEYF